MFDHSEFSAAFASHAGARNRLVGLLGVSIIQEGLRSPDLEGIIRDVCFVSFFLSITEIKNVPASLSWTFSNSIYNARNIRKDLEIASRLLCRGP